MIDRESPVTEDELHAYVDGELPAERRPAVEAWLAVHPEDASRVNAWRTQAESIKGRYGDIAHEPVPARLELGLGGLLERPLAARAHERAGGLAATLESHGLKVRDHAAVRTDAVHAHGLGIEAAHRCLAADCAHASHDSLKTPDRGRRAHQTGRAGWLL